MADWIYEEFSTVSTRTSKCSDDIFQPPNLRIPVLHGRNLFSTQECRKLRDLIFKKEELILKSSEAIPIAGLREGITTRWLSYNLFKWDDKEVLPLKQKVSEAYKIYLTCSGHKRWKNSAQCWANILRSQQRLTTHMHNYLPRATINGTIALSKVKTETVFVFPFPLLAKFRKTEHQQFSIPTTLGHIILIPGWVSHFTTPVPQDQVRVTLGFDIAAGLKKGEFIDFDDPKKQRKWPILA